MRFLKTNTATRITVGPFFDRTDGITPEVALTVTSCKLTLVVDTGGVPTLVLDTAPTASGGANDMVHITGDDAGFYDLELAAADVNYVGRAMLAITDAATHCPVFHEFMILPANVYDSLVGGTDTLNADVTQISGTNVSTSTAQLGVNVVSVADANAPFKKNVAVTKFMFYMELTAGGPGTGKTVTAEVSKDGGAFAAVTDPVTEVSDGYYEVDLSATEMNADTVTFIANATGCNQRNITIYPVG